MRGLTCFLGVLFLIVLNSRPASAQYYFYNDSYYDSDLLFELGGSVGAMNCLTDLGGKPGIGEPFLKDLNMGTTEFCGGLFFSALYKNKIGLRLEGTFGQVSAYDSVLKGVTDIAKERYNRNLNFRSSITEISLMAEIHPLHIFIKWDEKDVAPPRISPYLVGGVGFFSFNPQGKLGNNWIDLQPLSLEGQGFAEYPDVKPYKLQQLNIPFGMGIKYDLTPLLNLRAECIYRKLNTDYLDDCSNRYIDPAVFYNYLSGSQLSNALILNDRQFVKTMLPGGIRGSADDNDGYFSVNLKVSLIFGRQRAR
jgi:hypothetical protein